MNPLSEIKIAIAAALIGGSAFCGGIAAGEKPVSLFWSHDEAKKLAPVQPVTVAAQVPSKDDDSDPLDDAADGADPLNVGQEVIPQRLETRPRPDDDRRRDDDRFRDEDGVTIEALFRAAFEPYRRLPSEPMRDDRDDEEDYWRTEQIEVIGYAPPGCTACPAVKARLQPTPELRIKTWLPQTLSYETEQRFASKVSYPLIVDPQTNLFYCYDRNDGDDPLRDMDTLLERIQTDRARKGLMRSRRKEVLEVGVCHLEQLAIESGTLRFKNKQREFTIGEFTVRIPANFAIRGQTIDDFCRIDFPEKRPTIKRRGDYFVRWPISSIQDREDDVVFKLMGGITYVWKREDTRRRDPWGSERE